MLALALSAAFAQDAVDEVGGDDFSYQGIVSVGAAGGDGFDLIPVEVELDLNASKGIVTARADLDLHLDLDGDDVLLPDGGGAGFAGPLGPEWAMLEIGGDQYVRVGLTNPAIGFEDWDPWVNYLPTFSVLFNAASPGRNLGVEAGMYLPSGADVFVWGGYDVDWGYPMAGAGVSHYGDSFGTWSGVVVYPTAENANDGSKGTYATFDSIEFYPSDSVWVTLDGGGGLLTGKPFYGAQVFVQFLPEGPVGFTARLERADGADEVFDQYGDSYHDTAAGLGVRLQPKDWFRFDAEGKLIGKDGDFGPLVHGQLTVMSP